MIKRIELSASTSCLNKAAPDEPLFVLRANDPMAAMTIRHWATMSGALRTQSRIDEALMCADQMDTWRAQQAMPDAKA